MMGECYISMQKIMRNELKAFDKRDSFVFRQNLSTSRRISTFSYDLSSFNDQSRHNQSSSSPINNRAPSSRRLSSADPSQIRDLFLHQKNQQKTFKEKLTIAGKNIGKVRGTFKIMNLPLLHQMQVGTLTEKGIVMLKAPVLQGDSEDHGFFAFIKGKNSQLH